MARDKKASKDKKDNVVPEEAIEETAETETQEEIEVVPVQSELEALRQENALLKEKELRQFAEFDNFRKRTQREKAETFKNATAAIATEFITVLDNLERALESTDETEFKTGIEMIAKQFREVLSKQDVHEIEAMGVPFDPEMHNAVNQIEDENFGENTVCQVFQKGYKMGDKVIRHAMVVVANP